MSVAPRLSKDFSKLLYIASTDKFLAHSSCYQLKYLKWPVNDGDVPVTVIDKHKEYPKSDEDFCGIFGYN